MVKANRYQKEFYTDFDRRTKHTVICIHVPEYKVTLRMEDFDVTHIYFADKPDFESSCDGGEILKSHTLPAVISTKDIDISKRVAEGWVKLAKQF